VIAALFPLNESAFHDDSTTFGLFVNERYPGKADSFELPPLLSRTLHFLSTPSQYTENNAAPSAPLPRLLPDLLPDLPHLLLRPHNNTSSINT
jgi:hypothetical protein